MGSVLLEASACAPPIAATNAGGIPEVIKNDISGLLSPTRDPQALAANILRLIDEPDLGQKLSQAALSGLFRFGLKNMAQQMEKIYGSLV